MADHVNIAREVGTPVGSAANNPRQAYYRDLGNGGFAEVEAAYVYVFQGGVWVAWDGSQAVPTAVFNGKTTVTTAGTRVALASSQAVKSVTVKALSTNTGLIYVGNSSVSSTVGFQIAAGESVSFDIADLATVFLDAAVNGEGATYLAVN